MSELVWDQVGERTYETGVDHGVLYVRDTDGTYPEGVAWNGLTTVTESPSGAESTKQYADNIVYLNLISVEQFGGTIEAFTYPDEFGVCDGTAEPEPGVAIGQQNRSTFGLCYRTLKGNDTEGTDFGEKIHLIYGAVATPSEKAYATVNDSPEAIAFSWDITTTPVAFPGFKPSAQLTIDSTKVDPTAYADLQQLLYGTVSDDARLPLPAEVLALFSGTVTTVTPGIPTYVSGTHTLTIPGTANVLYYVNDVLTPAGAHVITEDVVVRARPAAGHIFPEVVADEWFFDFV